MSNRSILLTVLLLSQINLFSQNLEIDYAAYLKPLDPVWDTTHTYFYEGAFIGNGREGAMVYREDSNSLRWDINRTDLTAPSKNPEYTRARIGLGKYVLKLSGKIVASSMRIDLWNGAVVGTLKTTKGTINFRSYVHHVANVMVTEIEEINEIAQFKYVPEKAKVIEEYAWKEDAAKYKYPGEEIYNYFVKDVSISKQKFKAENSNYEVASLLIPFDKKKYYLSTIGTNVPFNTDSTTAYRTIENARRIGVEKLYETHIQWWHEFYKTTFVDIPDRKIASFYWIQKYKLGSSIRKDGPLLDLMGPWFAYTPWPAVWWNLNVQLTYSPLYALNLLDMGETLYKTLDKNINNLIENVPAPYRHNAAGIGRVTTFDLKGKVNLINSVFPFYDKEPGNLQWVMHNYYLQYLYTLDEHMLAKRIFPLLKRSNNLYLNILKKDKNNVYHLPSTFSPEYALTRDANYDLSLLRWGCKTLLAINQKLNLNDSLKPVWEEVLANLTPFPTDETGFRIGADTSLLTSHRHFSHLMMYYPLRLIAANDKEGMATVNKSIQHWLGMKEGLAGYSYTVAAAMYAAMGKGDSAVKYIHAFIKDLPVSTIYREAGPVIETPFSALTSINEFLIQSNNGIITVFPAVPTSWKNVAFEKLRTEQAFLVSAYKSNGTTNSVHIKSLMGAVCRIKVDRPLKNFKISGNRNYTYKIDKLTDVLEIDIAKDEEIIITFSNKAYQLNYKVDSATMNPFGMKLKK